MTLDNLGNKLIEFTPAEIARMNKSPDILRAVANDHMVCSLEADSIDNVMFAETIKFHDAREKELNTEADRLDELYGC